MVDKITLKIVTPQGEEKTVRVPPNAKTEAVAKAIKDKLNLPARDPASGRGLQYHLYDKSQNLQLAADKSLDAQGVKEGDTLRLESELVAG